VYEAGGERHDPETEVRVNRAISFIKAPALGVRVYFPLSRERRLWANVPILYLNFTATRPGPPLVSGEVDWRPLADKGRFSFVFEGNGTSLPIPPALSQPNDLFRRQLEMCVCFLLPDALKDKRGNGQGHRTPRSVACARNGDVEAPARTGERLLHGGRGGRGE